MKNIAYDISRLRPSHPSFAFLSLAVLVATLSLQATAGSTELAKLNKLTELNKLTKLTKPTKSSTAAGASLFRDKGCSYCHGTELQGTGRGPSLLKVRTQLKAAQIAEQIKNGGQKMPPFGDSVSQDEILQLVSFLRMKHPDAKTPAVVVPATGNSLSNPAQ